MAILLLLMLITLTSYAQTNEQDKSHRLYGGQYGPIVSADSLWGIARKVRQNDDLTIYQIMYSLFEHNPQSFMDENYNHLLDDTYLNIPAYQKIKQIDADVARAQGKLHEALWGQKKRLLKALYIKTTPSDAQVIILNMKANYDFGMKRQVGCYQVEVNKSGYQTKRAWVALGTVPEQQHFGFVLKKQNDSVLKMRKPIVGRYGPVKPDDSFWRIAANIRPDDKVSIYQVMYSLYRQNPQSFINHNYNQLKAGSYLTIPPIKVQKKTNYNKARLKAELDDKLWAAASNGQPTKQMKVSTRLRLAKMSDDYWGAGQCQ